MLDAGGRSVRPHHERFARIIDDDDPGVALLRDDDKDAVLDVFVGNRLVIKEGKVRACSFQFVNQAKGEDAENQTSERSGGRNISNLSERRINHDTGWHLPRNKAKSSLRDAD